MKKVLLSIRLRLSYLKLKHKLLMVCLLSALVPFAIFIVILHTLFADFNVSNNLNALQSSFEITLTTISNQTEMVKRSMSLLLANSSVRELLQNRPYNYDRTAQYAYKADADSLISYIEKENYVESLHIYIPDDFTFIMDERNYFPSSLIQDTGWYETLSEFSGKSIWIYDKPQEDADAAMLSYATKAIDLNDYRKSSCTVRINMDIEKLSALLRQAITVEGSGFYILSEDGTVLLSSAEDTPCLYRDFDPSAAGGWVRHEDGSAYYTYQAQIPDCGWYLVSVIGQADLRNLPLTESYVIYLCILLISSILIFMLCYIFTASITTRISYLAGIMRRVQDKKDLIPAQTTRTHDEIGDLMVSYNYLVDEMNAMIKREYISGVSQKNAEFRALRAQINPHFLYNTLEIIGYYAEEQDPERVNQLITNLAAFYKISLSSGQDFYQISQELSLLDAYISIINIRYQDIVTLRCEIPTEFYEYEIPKITLQPLVENAVVHGILESERRKGTIVLRAEEMGRNIVLSVEDDGVGIEAETLRKLNEGIAVARDHASQNHYGISNINERLKSVYGDNCQLRFVSTPGRGTTVFFILPRYHHP